VGLFLGIMYCASMWVFLVEVDYNLGNGSQIAVLVVIIILEMLSTAWANSKHVLVEFENFETIVFIMFAVACIGANIIAAYEAVGLERGAETLAAVESALTFIVILKLSSKGVTIESKFKKNIVLGFLTFMVWYCITWQVANIFDKWALQKHTNFPQEIINICVAGYIDFRFHCVINLLHIIKKFLTTSTSTKSDEHLLQDKKDIGRTDENGDTDGQNNDGIVDGERTRTIELRE